MQAVYQKKLPVGISICDASGNMGIYQTFAAFQDAASEHAEILGVGREASAARGLFWVTVRTRVHFYDRAALGSVLELTTWPKAPGKVRCDRLYQLTNGDKLIAQGRTEWCVVDVEKGAARPIEQVGFADDMQYRPDTLLDAPYARFKHDFADEDTALVYTVRASDIDLGRHMNNVAYLRMLLDSFRVKQIEEMQVQEMEIMFLNSCFEGEELSVLRRKTQTGYEFGVRKPDGKYAALAHILC